MPSSSPDNFDQPYRFRAATGQRWTPGLGGYSDGVGNVRVAELGTPQKAPLFVPEGGMLPQSVHPGLTGDYWRDVGSVFRGYRKALVNTALSPYHLGKALAADPAGFVAGLPGNIVGGIRGTVQGIFQLDDPELFGESFGSVLISAAAPRLGAAGVTGVRVARSALPKAAKLADECDVAYHYTTREGAGSIVQDGFQSSSNKMWVTPEGRLTAYQAVLDLALPPNKPYGAVLQVDLAGLRRNGYAISGAQQVGRAYNLPGGGTELVVTMWDEYIPARFFKWIR